MDKNVISRAACTPPVASDSGAPDRADAARTDRSIGAGDAALGDAASDADTGAHDAGTPDATDADSASGTL